LPTKFGQNFLLSEEIAENIVDSAVLATADNVLEIGPGKGILTKNLAKQAGNVLALEIDPELAKKLRSAHYKNTKIIEGDALEINLPHLIEENNFQKYKVVANLPYYITSKIIRLLLETKYPPSELVLMVQKEVGERIAAKDGRESLLSVSVKFYAEPELIFNVSRENFDPAPLVDSALIRIKRKRNVPKLDAKKFFSLVRAGFSKKRKMLANNLSISFHLPKNKIFDTLKKIGLETNLRAERLNIEDWINLYDNFEF
jgi:16S rRNA (adenine1518-N6/adenine1519-N6)-dimethyltransferase